MNKHTVIVIVASVVIAAPFVYGGWNIYSIEHLQFVAINEEKFSFFDIVNNGKISVCNPLPFYTTFDKLDIVLIFDQVVKGTLNFQGQTLTPSSVSSLEGKFSSDAFEETQYYTLHFDGMFSETTPIRIDPTKFHVVTEVHTSIIGFIPYSVSKEFSGLDFWNILNQIDSKSSCE